MNPTHPRMESSLKALDALAFAARDFARAAAKKVAPPRKKRGATVRPGSSTPMWNALVQSVQPYLARRGEKIKLGRILGVPPQRIHEYFVARTATPDAERTLALAYWLVQRREGLRQG